jgi:hypothetical protein
MTTNCLERWVPSTLWSQGHLPVYHRIYPRGPTRPSAWARSNETGWCSMSHATLLSLPKVSRQVYAETATLGYALGIITLDCPSSTLDYFDTMKQWTGSLTTAHVNSITDIQLDGASIGEFSHPLTAHHRYSPPHITKVLPSLTRIHIEWNYYRALTYRTSTPLDNYHVAEAARKFLNLEGRDDIQIIFHWSCVNIVSWPSSSSSSLGS